MNYNLRAPCDDCPFLREGGIRLRRDRIRQLAGGMLESDGPTFTCHKTTVPCEDDEEDGGRMDGPNAQHCAGALIFADKNGNHTQMMRIAGRLGMWHPDRMVGRDRVFDTIREMLTTAVDRPARRRGGRA